MPNALISIGGWGLPTPSMYVGTESTIVDAARNVQGKVIGAVIRESVAKVEAEWNYLSAADWASILQKFNTAYGGSFYSNVTFFNQVSNTWETRSMYVGDRTTSGAFKTDSSGSIVGYRNPKLSLIEV